MRTKIINVPYKEAIGSLMYAMILTHAEVTYVVNCVPNLLINPLQHTK